MNTAIAPTTKKLCRTIRQRHERAQTFNCRRITKVSLEVGRALYPETGYWKPQTRGDCADVPRPCPYVSCRHNLYLDVSEIGSIKQNFQVDPWDMKESCALDVAECGGMTLDEVGIMMNLTRERIRQIEIDCVAALAQDDVLLEHWGEPGEVPTKRRLPVYTEEEWGDADDLEDLEDMYIGDVNVWRKAPTWDGAVAAEFDELSDRCSGLERAS